MEKVGEELVVLVVEWESSTGTIRNWFLMIWWLVTSSTGDYSVYDVVKMMLFCRSLYINNPNDSVLNMPIYRMLVLFCI